MPRVYIIQNWARFNLFDWFHQLHLFGLSRRSYSNQEPMVLLRCNCFTGRRSLDENAQKRVGHILDEDKRTQTHFSFPRRTLTLKGVTLRFQQVTAEAPPLGPSDPRKRSSAACGDSSHSWKKAKRGFPRRPRGEARTKRQKRWKRLKRSMSFF